MKKLKRKAKAGLKSNMGSSIVRKHALTNEERLMLLEYQKLFLKKMY
jgi:hypothetical protein